MNCTDYEAVITVDGEAVCLDCLKGDPESDEFYPIFADSEWDSYPVCAYCGEVFDYVSLTPEGVETMNADRITCIADGSRGIYIPQYFAENYGDTLTDEEREILLSGPDHDLYWEVWAEIETCWEHEDENGLTWYLRQDDSLFMVREDYIEY